MDNSHESAVEEAIAISGFLHMQNSAALTLRIAERNAAWMTAPYDGGGRLMSRILKVGLQQKLVERGLAEAPLGIAETKSSANRFKKGIRDFNREEKD